jgi:hypothetical protein
MRRGRVLVAAERMATIPPCDHSRYVRRGSWPGAAGCRSRDADILVFVSSALSLLDVRLCRNFLVGRLHPSVNVSVVAFLYKALDRAEAEERHVRLLFKLPQTEFWW